MQIKFLRREINLQDDEHDDNVKSWLGKMIITFEFN